MIFTLGPYTLDVDVEKTKRYYDTAKSVGEECTCDGCQNLEKAVGTLPKDIQKRFTDLGIDLTKLIECELNCPQEDGTLLYGGFYYVCGTMLRGETAWEKISDMHFHLNEEKMYAVAPNFRICFSADPSARSDTFPAPILQMEIVLTLPWVLDKENKYLR